MKMNPTLKIVLIAIPVVIVLFLIVAAMQSSSYRIVRSAVINAPAGVVFPHVNVLKQWEAWSPWGKVDPNMKLTYEGPASGVGASYVWAGNNEVGEGRSTIAEMRANEFILFKLAFTKPMASTATAEFTFKPQGERTEVTWVNSGEKPFIMKAMCLFMSMDKMIGSRMESGLVDLKKAAETTGSK